MESSPERERRKMQTQNQLPISVPHDSIQQFPPTDCNEKRKQDIKWLIFQGSLRKRSSKSWILFPFCRFRSLFSSSPSEANDTREAPKKRNKERKRHEKMKITSDAEEYNMHDDDRCVRKFLGKGMRKMSWWQWYRSYTWIRCLFERKSPWVCLCLHICFVLASKFDGPCFISPLYFSRIRLLHHHRKKEKFPVPWEVPLTA